MHNIELYLIGWSILLLLSVIACKAAIRFGVPSLLVFLVVGMLAGSEGIGGIEFDNPVLAQSLGVVALIFILFAGGLDTEWKKIRPVFWQGTLLATVGVLITSVLTGFFAAYLIGLTWLEGLLLGSIVASTDAAAVFSLLRGKGTELKGGIKPLLELESGSNDPMAVFLTVGLLQILTKKETSLLILIPTFFQQMIIGGVVGFIAGKIIQSILQRMEFDFEGLYPVLTLAMVMFLFGATQVIGGNGFLAVYLAGLLIGRNSFLRKDSLKMFHDGLAWLMQITMFLTLGLLVYPSRLLSVAAPGLLLAFFLIFIARPISVFISLYRSPFSMNERIMIAWVGLRGAVPVILATYPLLAGLQKAHLIFNLVFFIVLTSVLFQGTSIPLMAKWLRVEAPGKIPAQHVNSQVNSQRDDSERLKENLEEHSQQNLKTSEKENKKKKKKK